MPRAGRTEILAIADDATGALEVGGQFAREGVAARVTTRTEFAPAPGALVVDAETRHAEPAAAAALVRRLAAAARDAGVAHYYKKTDSTLRGNIAAELQALIDVFPDRVLVYVPAYPKMKRTVSGGEVFVDGRPLAETAVARDPVRPAPGGDLIALLKAGCPARVFLARDSGELTALLGTVAARSFIVCDGQTDADLKATGEALRSTGRSLLLAGTGGFAGLWVRGLGLPRDAAPAVPPRPGRCLVAAGSMHPASREQVRMAQATGLPVCYLDAQPDPAVAASLAAGPWACLATPGDSKPGVSARIGGIVRETFRVHPFDALVVFGGSTAVAILGALGVADVRSIGELLPGIPTSLVRWQRRDILLVTKAGGFGEPDTLIRIRRLLEEQKR